VRRASASLSVIDMMSPLFYREIAWSDP